MNKVILTFDGVEWIFLRKDQKKSARISCGNDLEDPSPKIVVFAYKNIMGAEGTTTL